MNRTKSILSFVTAAALFAAAGQAQVVISQLYGGGGSGGSGPFNADFIELFNRGQSAVTLTQGAIVYSSATGTNWGQIVRLPANTFIAPGGYYLVQLDTRGSGTTALPTPDFVGGNTINASGSAGKIALLDEGTISPAPANYGGAAAPTIPAGVTLVDWIGYGATANARKGTANAPALTQTSSLVRGANGCLDNGENSTDFTNSTTITPRNTPTPANLCPTGPVPDIAVTLATAGCSVPAGQSATIVATATNVGDAGALAGSVVTISLPASVSSIAAPGASVLGSTITWNTGALAQGASATLNITATLNASGTFIATATAPVVAPELNSGNNSASVRNFVPFAGAGYSATLTPVLVAVPKLYQDATGFTAGALGEVSDGLMNVQIRSILGRPTASANGDRFIFWTNTSTGDISDGADFDGLLVAGQFSGGVATLTTLAAEAITSIDGSRAIRPGVNSGQSITAPAINDAGDFAFATQTIAGGEPIPTSVVAKGNVSNFPNTPAFTVVARQGDPAAGVGSGINWGPATAAANTSVFNATTVQSDGTVSFTGTISGAGVTTTNDFVAVSAGGSTVVARKGVTAPTGLAGTNAGAAITLIDASAAAALGFGVSASGSGSLVSGLAKLSAGTTADDGFVAFNGAAVLQEGFTIAGSGLTSSVASFDSALMQADGSWYAIGALSTGVDFVVRDGIVLAKTGDVATGNGEVWSDTVVARTFTGFTSKGADAVIFGLVNNPDTATDNVAVWKNGTNSQVIFREGQPITVNGRQFFANFLPANRGQAWISDNRKLFTLVTLYEANNICDNLFTNTVSALVTIDLPSAGPVCNNPSNISGPGQNTTAIDAELTADDIIVFLNRFFAGNLLSDVSGPGQNTTAIDGELTADDIIVFLNRFFAGC
jgi:hypothetical protein